MAIKQGRTDTWTKSSYSGGNGACVEVKSPAPSLVAVRDSKDPGGPALRFTWHEWRAFIAGVKQGEFDGPPLIGQA